MQFVRDTVDNIRVMTRVMQWALPHAIAITYDTYGAIRQEYGDVLGLDTFRNLINHAAGYALYDYSKTFINDWRKRAREQASVFTSTSDRKRNAGDLYIEPEWLELRCWDNGGLRTNISDVTTMPSGTGWLGSSCAPVHYDSIFNPPPGHNYYERKGLKAYIYFIDLKAEIKFDSNYVGSESPTVPPPYRIILYIDKRWNNKTTFNNENDIILSQYPVSGKTTTFFDGLNCLNENRFEILCEEYIYPSIHTITVSNETNGRLMIHKSIGFERPIQVTWSLTEDDGGPGVLSSIETGFIGLLCGRNETQPAGTPMSDSLEWSVRLLWSEKLIE